MEMNELFEALWNEYSLMTPSAKKIRRIFEDRGETVLNDHIAIRTFNDPRVNIEVLAAPFKKLGYIEKGEYVFKEKKLFAHHYEHPDHHDAPKIFISELILEQCTEDLRRIITEAIDQIPASELQNEELLLKGRLWKLSAAAYETLRKESEYASWMYIFGFCANHFTVFVNALKSFGSLEEVNSFLKDNGFKLNDAGGEIKGSAGQLLEQSSTIADHAEIDFEDGKKSIPSCYYEFARRYPLGNGDLYQGFIAASADKIFESTDVSLVDRVLSKKI